MTFSPEQAKLLGRLARLGDSHCSGLRFDSEDGVFNSLSRSHATVLGDRELGPEAHLSSCGLPLGASRVSPILFSLRAGHGSWSMVVGGAVGHLSPAGLGRAFASDKRVLLFFLT